LKSYEKGLNITDGIFNKLIPYETKERENKKRYDLEVVSKTIGLKLNCSDMQFLRPQKWGFNESKKDP
jgi:hypothetical protein